MSKDNFPAHWGKPPGMQTCDVVRLPRDYGWGSGTLRAWIEYHMEQDRQAAVERFEAELHHGKEKGGPQ